MKKMVWVIANLVLLLGLLLAGFGCKAPPPTSAPIPAATPKPAAAPAEKVYNWKAVTFVARISKHFEEAARYVRNIEEMSNGRIKIELFAGGEFVAKEEEDEARRKRIIDLSAYRGPAVLSGKVPGIEFEVGLPGTLKTAEEARIFWWDRGFRDYLNEVVYIPTFNSRLLGPVLSPQTLMASKVPISSLADFKGLKVRAAGVNQKWFGKLDVKTVYITWGEVYTGLATGVADVACIGSAVDVYDMKLYEVAPYLLVDPPYLAYEGTSAALNNDAWNELPDDLKKIVISATKTFDYDLYKALSYSVYDYLGKMVAKGAKLTKIASPDDLTKWSNAAVAVMDDIGSASQPGKKMRDMLVDYMRFLGYVK